MNFADTLRGLQRRWYIVIPGILLAAALAVGASYLVPPGYERSSTQLLIPGAASLPDGANPYLFLGGLSPAADVIVRAVGSENVLNEVVEKYPGVQVKVTRDTTTAGPVMLIVVTAASDAAAEDVLALVVERTATVVNDLQETENIAEQNQMTVQPITVDTQSDLQQRRQFVAIGAGGLVGLALTLFVAGLVDGLSLQRMRRGATAGSTEVLTDPLDRDPDVSKVKNPTSRVSAPPMPSRPPRPSTVMEHSSNHREPDQVPSSARSAR